MIGFYLSWGYGTSCMVCEDYASGDLGRYIDIEFADLDVPLSFHDAPGILALKNWLVLTT